MAVGGPCSNNFSDTIPYLDDLSGIRLVFSALW